MDPDRLRIGRRSDTSERAGSRTHDEEAAVAAHQARARTGSMITLVAALLLSACNGAASGGEQVAAAGTGTPSPPVSSTPTEAPATSEAAAPGGPDSSAAGSAEQLVRQFFTAASTGRTDQLEQIFTADPVVVDGPDGGRRMTSIAEITAWVEDIAQVDGGFTITRVLSSEPETVRFQHTYQDNSYTGDDSGSATVVDGRISQLEITGGQ